MNSAGKIVVIRTSRYRNLLFHVTIDAQVDTFALPLCQRLADARQAAIVRHNQPGAQIEVWILPGDRRMQNGSDLNIGLANVTSRPFLDDVLQRTKFAVRLRYLKTGVAERQACAFSAE